MLTEKEANEQGLKYGKDYVYLQNIIYRIGDKFLKNGKEIEVKEIIDQTHFFDQGYFGWHVGMFDDYRCRHCLELNDPALAPDPNKTPFEVLQANVDAGRSAFRTTELLKWEKDIYSDYHKIYFFEEMAYYLENGNFDEDYCEFLNKEGSLLLQGMYGYFIDHPNMTVNNSEDASFFVESYADYYGYKKENCM